jgi:hypothetical protein
MLPGFWVDGIIRRVGVHDPAGLTDHVIDKASCFH